MGGYYRTYGVPTDLFDTTWHTAIYGGSVYSLPLVAMVVIGLFIAGVFYCLIAPLLGIGGNSPLGRKADQWVQAVIANLRHMPFSQDALQLGLITFLSALALAIPVGLYWTLLYLSEDLGTNRATREIEMIRSNDTAKMAAAKMTYATIFYMDGTTAKAEDGIQIGCEHNSVCALRKADRTVIIPTKNIVRVDAKPLLKNSERSEAPTAKSNIKP